MQQITNIYALYCPVSSIVVYVGKTTKPIEERLKQHIANPSNPCLKYWIGHLKYFKKTPVVMLLERCSSRRSSEREGFWIQYYSKTNPYLFNINTNVYLLTE